MMNNHALLGPLDLLALLSQTQPPSLSQAQHCEPASLLDYSPGISMFSGYFGYTLLIPTLKISSVTHMYTHTPYWFAYAFNIRI